MSPLERSSQHRIYSHFSAFLSLSLYYISACYCFTSSDQTRRKKLCWFGIVNDLQNTISHFANIPSKHKRQHPPYQYHPHHHHHQLIFSLKLKTLESSEIEAFLVFGLRKPKKNSIVCVCVVAAELICCLSATK